MLVELRPPLIGCEFWSDYVVADSDEKFPGIIQVCSAQLSWVLAKVVSMNAIWRAATSSTQKKAKSESEVGEGSQGPFRSTKKGLCFVG